MHFVYLLGNFSVYLLSLLQLHYLISTSLQHLQLISLSFSFSSAINLKPRFCSLQNLDFGVNQLSQAYLHLVNLIPFSPLLAGIEH